MKPIAEIGEKLGLTFDDLIPYGHTKAKINLATIEALKDRPDGKLVLVTAITPTPAGEGKTTTTVGLGDGLNRIGHKAIMCLREPSLGPCFGMKGGAAGGGYAQVVPMEDINLHFTGDFHAITSAHNLLSAMIDNHIYWGNELNLDARRVGWRRVVDMNDRALRDIVCSLGGVSNGFPRQTGYDITVASEIMAILCLSTSMADLERRLGQIVIGQTRDASRCSPRTEGAGRHDGAAARRADAEPGADAGEQPGLRAWRAVRQHRPWLQLGDGDQGGLEAGRFRGHRSRLRRRSGGGEVLRHQVPQGGAQARRRGDRGHGAGAQDAWRRGQGRAQGGERRGAQEGARQSRPPHRRT
jgi:hypothetical protein